jgi:hypothetical protein
MILGYGNGSNQQGQGQSLFAVQIANAALMYVLYDVNFSSSVYSAQWNIEQVVQGSNASYSIRTIIRSIIPGGSTFTNNSIYITASSNPNVVTAQYYDTQPTSNIAIDAQQWRFTKDQSNPLAYNIQSVLNNKYLGLGNNLQDTPVAFLLG